WRRGTRRCRYRTGQAEDREHDRPAVQTPESSGGLRHQNPGRAQRPCRMKPTVPGPGTPSLDATAVLREVLTLIDRPAGDALSYKRLPGKVGIHDVTVSIVLLREVSE